MSKNQSQHSNIKFKGKCKLSGKWYTGHYYIEYPPLNPIIPPGEEPEKEKHWIVFAGSADWNMPRMQQVEIDQDTLRQYIGKNDAKDNEIYTGHLLSVYIKGEFEILIVEWDYENLRYVFRNVHNDDICLINEIDMSDSLIIGNKFDDPEIANIEVKEKDNNE